MCKSTREIAVERSVIGRMRHACLRMLGLLLFAVLAGHQAAAREFVLEVGDFNAGKSDEFASCSKSESWKAYVGGTLVCQNPAGASAYSLGTHDISEGTTAYVWLSHDGGMEDYDHHLTIDGWGLRKYGEAGTSLPAAFKWSNNPDGWYIYDSHKLCGDYHLHQKHHPWTKKTPDIYKSCSVDIAVLRADAPSFQACTELGAGTVDFSVVLSPGLVGTGAGVSGSLDVTISKPGTSDLISVSPANGGTVDIHWGPVMETGTYDISATWTVSGPGGYTIKTGAGTVDVIAHVEMANDTLDVCADVTSATVDLSVGNTMSWSVVPTSGLTGTADASGTFWVFDPSLSTPGSYTVTAGQPPDACEDSCEVNVYKVAFVQPAETFCWTDGGTYNAFNNLTADTYDKTKLVWSMTPSGPATIDSAGLVTFGTGGGIYTIQAGIDQGPGIPPICIGTMELTVINMNLTADPYVCLNQGNRCPVANITVSIGPPGLTGTLDVGVYDGTTLIKTIPMSGTGSIYLGTWDGRDSSGAIVLEGAYTVKATWLDSSGTSCSRETSITAIMFWVINIQNPVMHTTVGEISKFAIVPSSPSQPVTWSIQSPPHHGGCVIDSSSGVVTFVSMSEFNKDSMGAKTVTITVRATSTELPCCYAEATLPVTCDTALAGPAISGCSGCGSTPGGGFELGSVKFLLGMGCVAHDSSAGYLTLIVDRADQNMANPEFLEYSFRNSAVDVIVDVDNANILRQIRVPQGLVDILVVDEFTYSINVYEPAAVGNKSGDLYQVTGAPRKTYTIENPDQSAAHNRLKITASPGVETLYTWDESNNRWTLSKGNGLVVETATETATSLGRELARDVMDDNGHIASRVKLVYTDKPWGEVLTQFVEDVGGANLTTTYTYYEDSNEPDRYGRTRQVDYPDGSWEKFDYQNGLVSRVIKPWLDSQASSGASEAHETLYAYAEGDVRPTNTVERVLGIVVAESFYQREGDEREWFERAYAPGTHCGDTNNDRTVTTYFPADAAGKTRVRSITHHDGSYTWYRHEVGQYNFNAADPGASSFGPGTGDLRITVVNGTLAETNGIAGKSLMTRSIVNGVCDTVMEETFVYTGSEYERITWSVTEYEGPGRVSHVYHADGRREEKQWATCCGQPERVTDGEGVIRTFTYDDLGRLETRTKEAAVPLEEIFTYDAAGRRSSVTRTAGGLSLVSSNRYDAAGRLLFESREDGTITTNQYLDGGRTMVTYLPGGATRVTEQYVDGNIKSVTGSAVIPEAYEYGVNPDGSQWTKRFEGPAGTSSPKWHKTTSDFFDRPILEEKSAAGGGVHEVRNFYNTAGRLRKTTRTGEAGRLFEYDALGELKRSGLDVDSDDALDPSGMDRITEDETSCEWRDNAWWRVRVSRVYARDNNPEATTVSAQRELLTNLGAEGLVAKLVMVDVRGNETVRTRTVDRDRKTVIQRIDHPDSIMDSLVVAVNGLVVSNQTQTGVLYGREYDALERPVREVDPRTGPRVTHYNDLGQVDYGEDAATNRTTYGFEPLTGRRSSVTDPLGNTVYTAYDARGNVTNVWGATYPVAYEYDGYGRMIALRTWRDPAGAPDLTRWEYDEATGLLTNKVYADGNGLSYTYRADSKLATRTWARALVTTYSYTNSGELVRIDYSDSTPDVAVTYDRLGRQSSVTDAVGSREFSYDSALQQQSEIIWPSSGSGGSNVITRLHDTLGRPGGFTLDESYAIGYGYESAGGRLETVSWSLGAVTGSVTYARLPDSELLQNLTLTGAGGSLTSSRAYESTRDVLTQVRHTAAGQLVSRYDYVTDAGGRRTSVANAGAAFRSPRDGYDLAAFNAYGYNTRSELTEAQRYWGTNVADQASPVDGQTWAYGYDSIGNRTNDSRNGINALYSANELNQYTSREVRDRVDVMGVAATQALVAVNWTPAARQGAYYYKELQVTNDSAALYLPVSVVGVVPGGGSNGTDVVTLSTGQVFAARSPEAFDCDADGNLVRDGRWEYDWDAENRLIAMETGTNALAAGAPRVRMQYEYDYMGRRVSKTAYRWEADHWSATSDHRFLYDGWNLIQELITDNGTLNTNSYIWGLDLSGSLQGAGGIAGLLTATLGGTTSVSSVFYLFDANGNVGQVLDATGTNIVAAYEYSPYGEPVRAEGPLANVNPYRFSSKYTDQETGLVYYGYRYYAPALGRWLSRDPIGESMGLNLAHFTMNSPIRDVDYLGLLTILWPLHAADANIVTCGYVKLLMDAWAVGWNNQLWNWWKSGLGGTHDIPFAWFDPTGWETLKVYKRAERWGLVRASRLRCTGSGTDKYPVSEYPKNLITYMIYYWELKGECDIEYSAQWDGGCCKCRSLATKVSCKLEATDTVDFWDDPTKKFALPPYMVDDQFINACSYGGLGFKVKATQEGSMTFRTHTCTVPRELFAY